MKKYALIFFMNSVALGNITDGLYRLHNHPDGQQTPPPYGLILDGLDGNSSRVFTFDFDFDGEARDAAMFLDFNSDTNIVHIFGTVYGGLNRPSNTDLYEGPKGRDYFVGWWDVDFTYNYNVGYALGDDDIISSENPGNNGSITRTFEGSRLNDSYDLVDFNGDNPFSFRFGNEDDDKGYRGFNGFSGHGWLTHNGRESHTNSSDWLFTAEKINPIPTVSSLSLGLMGIIFIVLGLRNNRLVE